jgi:cell division septum initiation protein DivIVA
LLEQGVVEPSGPRESLVLLAKQKYRAYQDTASLYASSASSLGSHASASVSTAIYGDATYQASKSLSSIAAQATKDAARIFDNAKDYVYSTWSDSQLESYLREKGVIKDNIQYTRQDLLAKMQDAYAKASTPIWESWSDSYMVRS